MSDAITIQTLTRLLADERTENVKLRARLADAAELLSGGDDERIAKLEAEIERMRIGEQMTAAIVRNFHAMQSDQLAEAVKQNDLVVRLRASLREAQAQLVDLTDELKTALADGKADADAAVAVHHALDVAEVRGGDMRTRVAELLQNRADLFAKGGPIGGAQ